MCCRRQERSGNGGTLRNAHFLRALERRERPRGLQRKRIEKVQFLSIREVRTVVILDAAGISVGVQAVEKPRGFAVREAESGDIYHAAPEDDEEQQEEQILATSLFGLESVFAFLF